MIDRENGPVSRKPKFLQPIDNTSPDFDGHPALSVKRNIVEKRQSAAVVNSDLSAMENGLQRRDSVKKQKSRKGSIQQHNSY